MVPDHYITDDPTTARKLFRQLVLTQLGVTLTDQGLDNLIQNHWYKLSNLAHCIHDDLRNKAT